MTHLKHTLFALALASAGAVGHVSAQNLSRAQYIERYAPVAIAHAEKYGIPASVKMAQGILESGDGNGRLARTGNTHFNIKVKASDNWRGRIVYHDDDRPHEAFRAYDSPEESWLDHSEYLDRQPRYDSLFRYGPTDYRSWARGLKAAGYATDPQYAQKLVKIIEDNELWRLDRGELPRGAEVLVARNDPPAVAPPPAAPVTPPSGEGIDPDRFVVKIRPKSKK